MPSLRSTAQLHLGTTVSGNSCPEPPPGGSVITLLAMDEKNEEINRRANCLDHVAKCIWSRQPEARIENTVRPWDTQSCPAHEEGKSGALLDPGEEIGKEELLMYLPGLHRLEAVATPFTPPTNGPTELAPLCPSSQWQHANLPDTSRSQPEACREAGSSVPWEAPITTRILTTIPGASFSLSLKLQVRGTVPGATPGLA